MNENEHRRLALYLRHKVEIHKALNAITEEEYQDNLYRAMMWHGPFNWSGGDKEVCEMHSFDYLFPDAREKEGLSRGRFYFYFKDTDCTDWVNVADKFMNCTNYDKYLAVWEKHAPKSIRSEIYFLGSLVKMTTSGMKYEKDFIEANNLIKSTGVDDFKHGVDAWTTDGEPVQIKSPATARGMR